MLQLRDICKSYATGDIKQAALSHVSLSFRNSELVAVLGPSGSGKTTLLNIMGGLDRYDEGDMVVDGMSADEFKDRDWDAYRSNHIGFVFQNYNLIEHQTIQKNVELALTIAGVDSDERAYRAKSVLEAVGLGDHLEKYPWQLSGGQVQRVAIARALINDPQILLADEPTGALDSASSVQIMDILKEISTDRLVVVVTHNPEIAEDYATRVIHLVDGTVRSDSDPYLPTAEQINESRKELDHASMSPLTALQLSYGNLVSKKGRSIMTALAGAIGIIGIALILALANGMNHYVENIEEGMLSAYPIEITTTGYDVTSIMANTLGIGDGSNSDDPGHSMFDEEDTLHESKTITSLFEKFDNNDLISLKLYLDENESKIAPYVNSIDYSYDVEPQIYDANTMKGIRRINPDDTFSAIGADTSSAGTLLRLTMGTDVFNEMMGDPAVVESQYTVEAGHWPENYDECVVVLSSNGNIADLITYALGLRDHAEIEEMVTQFVNGEEITTPMDELDLTYEDLLKIRMKLINAANCYTYDKDHEVWVDRSEDEAYMAKLIDQGEDIKVVGVVRPRSSAGVAALAPGIYYLPSLTQHIITQASQTRIVQQQLDYSQYDVFTGKLFSEDGGDSSRLTLDMNTLFAFDKDAAAEALSLDSAKLTLDPNTLSSEVSFDTLPAIGDIDAQEVNVDLSNSLDKQALGDLTAEALAGYANYIVANMPSDGSYPDYNALLQSYAQSSELQALLTSHMDELINTSAVQASLSDTIRTAIENNVKSYLATVQDVIQADTERALQKVLGDLETNLSGALTIDPDSFSQAFKFRMTEEELANLVMSLMNNDTRSYVANLAKLGYADMKNPSAIKIYPVDFQAKRQMLAILDDYNNRMEISGQPAKRISYTDVVGALMSMVTNVIDMVSYILIAFVAISLVVSSIMIGIITYISVLERRKEIGILRALGASRSNIAEVFSAETIMEGLVAGVIGVAFVAIVSLPANMILRNLAGVADALQLEPIAAAVLVVISMLLAFIAGLYPALSAARKEPVEALRAE